MEQHPITPLDPKKIPFVLGGLMLGLLLSALDGTIVSTVMPTIVRDLHGMEYYVWPFTMYMLCSTIAIVVFGKFSDLYGRRKIFLFGILIFLAGSVLCGLAPDMVLLTLFRGLQGIGGGILMTISFIIVAELFPIRERGKYMGILVSVFGIASIVGPLLGGVITDVFGWRWVFYINLPVGLIAAYLVVTHLHETAVLPEKKQIDYAGIASFILCMVPLLLALSLGGTILPWTSPQVLGLLILSGAMLFCFVRTQRVAKSPLLPLTLFRNPIYSITAAAAFLANALMFAGVIYLPLFMQGVKKVSAAESGMVVTPMVLALVFAAVITGRLISSTGKYRALSVAGFVVTGAGIGMLVLLNPETPVLLIVLASALLGIGTGMMHPLLAIAAQNAFPPKDLGVVSSSQQFFRNMGATILTPVFGFVMYAGLGSMTDRNGLLLLPSADLAHAIGEVFLFCAGIVAICIILVLCLQEIPLRSRGKESTGPAEEA
jgi:EmrB/QacA subfamily drug resistance transporter